jgi:uncharacterized membrane protein YidH (DUF202 family)
MGPELIILLIVFLVIFGIVRAVRGYRRRTKAIERLWDDDYRPPRQKLP